MSMRRWPAKLKDRKPRGIVKGLPNHRSAIEPASSGEYGLLLFVVSISSFFIVLFTYFVYFTVIYSNKKHVSAYLKKLGEIQKSEGTLPNVSIIVSAYNESKVIRRKIKNISDLNYPLEKIELLVIDDFSKDETSAIAENVLKELQLNGRIIRNPERIGLNPSLNKAFQLASHSIIGVTDSDVTLEKDALKNSLTVLEHFENAGGVTGRIMPVHNTDGLAPTTEGEYRHYYDRSMLTESSLHSAFPGNGPLIIFKSYPNYSIPAQYGSSDANIAMNVIKNGKRLLYIPNAIIYEPVPETVGQQKLQKVRRATRLIQAFIHNTDVFLNGTYGSFGQLIFPLKYLIHVLCPLLLLIGLVTFIPFLAFYAGDFLQLTIAFLMVLTLGVLAISRHIRSFFSSFLFHQVYLVLGLFSLPRQSKTWKTIERR
jgi:biofilm PGA synthesis N-glycosyltransferase PgaC